MPAVIEFALGNVLGIADANSSEMESTPHPVIDLIGGAEGRDGQGRHDASGRLSVCAEEGFESSPRRTASSRFRSVTDHRYEFNNDYLEQFEAAGMQAVGINPDTGLVEVVEVANHPCFVGTQHHPEYKSTGR